MKIALLEPFFGGSHRQWAEGYQSHSGHEIRIFGLPGRHWKWRMHGAAVTLARQLRESDFQPDLILATDMLDLAAFLGLTRNQLAGIPVAIYFHENQLAYPWSPDDPDPELKRDNHYSFINFTSALAADRVFFNSPYNRDSFLEGLPDFLRAFPDHRESDQVSQLRKKCRVLPLGMDLQQFAPAPSPGKNDAPLILWNHRWEYDKNPQLFFDTLITLDQEGINFRLAVVGERYAKVPPVFATAHEALQHKIIQWGFTSDAAAYRNLLHQSDILPVTSNQDFFGGSVVEAMYCGCRPLLPNRLAYPMHIPPEHHGSILYGTDEDFQDQLRKLLKEEREALPVREWVAGYDWSVLAGEYDGEMERLPGK